MTALRMAWVALPFSVMSGVAAGQGSPPTGDANERGLTDTSFVPATLHLPTATTAEDIFPFPDRQDDFRVSLTCGRQRGDGHHFRSFDICFGSGDETGEFELAFLQGAPRLEIAGGLVNGRRPLLWIPYSVEFIKQGANRQVQLYQNHGDESALYGRNYTAPQRILPTHYGRGVNLCTLSYINAEVIWITAIINIDGKPKDVRVLTKVAEDCRWFLENSLSESSFIPAYYEGSPVPASFLGPAFAIGPRMGR